MRHLLLLLILLCLARPAQAEGVSGNSHEDSFQAAKRVLESHVYPDHRVTIYCAATFDADNNVTLPPGFTTAKHQTRASKIEWEHVVPAENFGRTFSEWRDGHPDCQDKRGPFKGRKCAERVSKEYRFMQADMYNLYPAGVAPPKSDTLRLLTSG